MAQAQAQAEALRAASPCLYPNEPQTCEDVCPEGTEGEAISVTVDEGVFTAETQEEANALALAAACAEVAILRSESPCETPPEPEEEPGSLWGMGWNFFRNLGTNDGADKLVPTIVGITSPALTWVKVDGNETFAMGLKSDKTLWSWGSNFNGELGHGTRSISPSTAYHAYFPVQIGTDNDWMDFACGDGWAIAVKEDASVYAWGLNDQGQLGLNDTTLRISPTLVSGLTDVVSVGAAARTAFAIRSDGTLWACGNGSVGQLGDGVIHDVDEFIQIGVAADWVKATGSTDPSGQDSVAGLREDGSVYAWGVWDTAIVPTSAAATLISAGPFDQLGVGNQFLVARKTDGTVWTIGSNAFGQLGIGSLTDSDVFVQVGVATNWAKVGAGSYHAVALNDGGEFYGWGSDFWGELGQGSIANDRQTPVQIGPDDLWINVFAIGGLEGYSFGLRSVTTEPPPPTGTSGTAFGGVVSIDSGTYTHRFDYSSNFIVVDGAGKTFDVLIVGGGGGGGGMGGGSGARVIKLTGISLADGTYPVVIGAGGLGVAGTIQGHDGGDSSFNGNTADGGVGGGATNDDGSENGRGGYNGSGAGGINSGTPAAGTGGTGSSGRNGGNAASVSAYTGGGGGAGNGTAGSNGAAVLATSATGGAGGTGTADSITGASVRYGAGGGGGAHSSAGGSPTTTGGLGGNSVGGRGGKIGTAGEAAKTPGSGGGGGGGAGFSQFGGDGARGVVIIQYTP